MAFTKKDEEAKIAVAKANEKEIDDYFKPSVDLEEIDHIVVAIQGRPKVGKSHFCITVAEATDGPLYIIDTEGAIKVNVLQFPKEIRERIFVSEALTFAGKANNKINLVESLDALIGAVNKVSDAAMAEPDIKGTIIIDSATDIWEWLQIWLDEAAEVKRTKTGAMPRFEWGKANEKYAEIMYMLMRTGWNIILTFRAKEACNSDGVPLGYDIARWQKNTAHWVDLVTEIRKENDGSYTMRFLGGRYGDKLPDLPNPTMARLMTLLKKESGVKFK
jgi:hypothetical protein